VADFGTFVTGHLFGGAFFHLLLGGVVGALLGAIGGALTVVLIRVLKLPDRRANAIAGRIPPCV
jgi:tetrahydromethanopterin S-methyltransferase subunit D